MSDPNTRLHELHSMLGANEYELCVLETRLRHCRETKQRLVDEIDAIMAERHKQVSNPAAGLVDDLDE